MDVIYKNNTIKNKVISKKTKVTTIKDKLREENLNDFGIYNIHLRMHKYEYEYIHLRMH